MNVHKEELHLVHLDVRTVVEDSLVNVLKDFILSKEGESSCEKLGLNIISSLKQYSILT